MGRILCLDYGSKRVGVAMTDELKIIASPYETISPSEVIPFIKSFKEKNKVEKIVVGLPHDLKGNVDKISASLILQSYLERKRL